MIIFKERRTTKQLETDLSLMFDYSLFLGKQLIIEPVKIYINYNDTFQRETKRIVHVDSIFSFMTASYFSGWCESRYERRTFKISRLVSAEIASRNVFNQQDIISAFENEIPFNGIQPYINETDFFLHPKVWGNYRRSLTTIKSKSLAWGISEDQRISLSFDFVLSSMKSGTMSGWHDAKSALAAVFLADIINVDEQFWVHQLEKLKNGKFSKRSLDEALELIETL